jgi:hypothetical protein
MEHAPNQESIKENGWVSKELTLLSEKFPSGTMRALVLAMVSLTSAACSTASVGGKFESNDSVSKMEWSDSTKQGDFANLCDQLGKMTENSNEIHVGEHTYSDGTYQLRGTKLSDGRTATLEVTGPDGTVYHCKK